MLYLDRNVPGINCYLLFVDFRWVFMEYSHTAELLISGLATVNFDLPWILTDLWFYVSPKNSWMTRLQKWYMCTSLISCFLPLCIVSTTTGTSFFFVFFFLACNNSSLFNCDILSMKAWVHTYLLMVGSPQTLHLLHYSFFFSSKKFSLENKCILQTVPDGFWIWWFCLIEYTSFSVHVTTKHNCCKAIQMKSVLFGFYHIYWYRYSF